MAIIVIDAGHGGDTKVGGSSPNNATAPEGTLEKELTLDISKRVQRILSAMHDVRMTRQTDVNVGIAARAHVARDAAADVFLSIHFNGFSNPSVQGTETLIWPGTGPTEKSYVLANLVQKATVGATGYRDRGIKDERRLGVLNPQNHVATTARCLVEISFITGPGKTSAESDERRLKDARYKDSIAEALAEAIEAYL
ncbi:N-acetylmuramoyl-L-alanine amidase family protein [Rosistilla oblonga]|uniref:N-acetylmuramoyl-L-alanine amidase family protein n=1 Tax=Rosistilla oblonga TaxID=2527990 RepID=UPI003A97EF5B